MTSAARMPRTFETGQLLAGKYRVERALGRGAMGVVLAATSLHNGLPVAIKVLVTEALGPADRARFVQEAAIAMRLRSEHTVRVLEIGALEDGVPFTVMERLHGEDLGRLLDREGPQPPERAIAWLLDACAALGEAHAAGVVHRDVKPANMFLATPAGGGEPLVKILDFGLSKLVEDAPGRPRLTTTLAVFGSPAYMAPEQLVDSGKVDPRADIYSLGVTLYEVLSGKLPFMARSAAELAAIVMRDPPRPLRSVSPAVPAGLERVVMRCLEKRPAERYQTAAELAAALTATLVDPREAPKTIHMNRAPGAETPEIVTAPLAMGRPARAARAPHGRAAKRPSLRMWAMLAVLSAVVLLAGAVIAFAILHRAGH